MGRSSINGQAPCLMGKSTISTGPFSIANCWHNQVGYFSIHLGHCFPARHPAAQLFSSRKGPRQFVQAAQMKTGGATQASPKVMSVSQSAEGDFFSVSFNRDNDYNRELVNNGWWLIMVFIYFQGYIYEYPIIIPLVSILNYLIGDTLWLCQT